METKENCPEKIAKMVNELRKDHLEALDYFLARAYNLTPDQKNSWLKLRSVLVGKEKVTTRIELCSYEDHLCNMQDFLKNAEKQRKNLQKKRGIRTVVNIVPILLTDSEDELTNYPSSSKTIENSAKRSKWTTPMPISDINDQPVSIRDNRNSPKDAQFSPLDPVQPEMISRMPLNVNEIFVAQHNFKQRPPPVLPGVHQTNKTHSNQYFRKNTKNNPRISRYQNDRQPHSSCPPKKPQESYRDYKLRKEQAERHDNGINKSNETVLLGNVQHRNDEPLSSPVSNLVTAFEPILSKFQENFVATNKESIINEPVEVAQPQLLEIDDNYFSTMIPLLDESYIQKVKEIKQECGFDLVPPDEESSRGECPDENDNFELLSLVKQEPEENVSDIDESYIQNVKEIHHENGFELVPPDEERSRGEYPDENANFELLSLVKQEPEENISDIDESYIQNVKKIHHENGFELVPPDKESSRGKCPDENANFELLSIVKQEPEENVSNIDETTADFTEHFNGNHFKEEPIDK